MWRLLLLACLHLASGWYNKDYGEMCNPQDWVVDGAFYCGQVFYGWWKDGAGVARASGTQCYTAVGERRDCWCSDCGPTWTRCVQSRCDDATEQWASKESQCYTMVGGFPKYTDPTDKDYCFKKKIACDPSVCANDEQLVGCMRASAGVCTPCPDTKGLIYYKGVPLFITLLILQTQT